MFRLELLWRALLLLTLGMHAAAFVVMAMKLPAPLHWRLLFSVPCAMLGAWPVLEARHSLLDLVLGRTRIVHGVALGEPGRMGGRLLRLPDGTTATAAQYLKRAPPWISALEPGQRYRAVVSARTLIVLAPPTLERGT